MQIIFEDRTYGGNVPYIDLTPISLWGKDIQKHVCKAGWETIRAHVAGRVREACELCQASAENPGVMGSRSNKFNVEMRFEHDFAAKTAVLRRLLHTCAGCTQAIHLRQTEMMSANIPRRGPFIGALDRLQHFHGSTITISGPSSNRNSNAGMTGWKVAIRRRSLPTSSQMASTDCGDEAISQNDAARYRYEWGVRRHGPGTRLYGSSRFGTHPIRSPEMSYRWRRLGRLSALLQE